MQRRIIPIVVISLAIFAPIGAAHAQGTAASPGPATGIPRTASGAAVGYEMSGASIPQSQLDELPDRVTEALASCASEAAPLIGRPVNAVLTVSPPGRVTEVRFDGDPRPDEQNARACVQRALSGLRFASRARPTTLTLELAFREQRGGGRSGGGAAAADPRTAAYRESVVRAIESHQPAVHACFERSRRAFESPERQLRVELTIQADGRVRGAVPAGDLFPQLTECLNREIGRWTVPRPPTAPFPMDHRFDGNVAAYGE
ncbi:hypothetical protein [Sandaracinus amylolyticus]|uniref:hypothetical protein n=1 Tax=Sandaracinus amylolyticus TaxID=927083 RepID=UPI001F279618|nr:hypothetical protein [Sandaracinus amylolyticus]UJR86202.1 Hypothetical protein I5071_82840 [Sandaracinus amylolyticus]